MTNANEVKNYHIFMQDLKFTTNKISNYKKILIKPHL